MDFLALLSRLAKLEKLVSELETRVHPVQLAQVTDIDPIARKIRVSRESQGGQFQSDWIQAGRSSSHTDEPIAPIGTTVLIAFVEGNPHDGYLLRTLANDTNPPDPLQRQPELDNTIAIPNDERRTIGGIQFDRVERDRTIETGGEMSILTTGAISIDSEEQSIDVSAIAPGGKVTITGFQQVRLADASGAYIQLANGLIEIVDRTGRKMVMGAGNWQFDLAGGTMSMINVGDATINGKSIAVVGAIDTHNDTLTSRGY